MIKIIFLITISIACFLQNSLCQNADFPLITYKMKGVSKGGELIFSDTNYSPQFTKLLIPPSFTPSDILPDLAQKIRDEGIANVYSINHETLELLGDLSLFSFSGTETGFNIPMPITGLTLYYSKNVLYAKWMNPVQYDSIHLRANTKRFVLNGTDNFTSFPITKKEFGTDVRIMLIGIKDSIPSPVAAEIIELNSGTVIESSGHQGFNGLQPNWIGQNLISNIQWHLDEKAYIPNKKIVSVEQKPFKQHFKPSDFKTTSCISRSFFMLENASLGCVSLYCNQHLFDSINNKIVELKVISESGEKTEFASIEQCDIATGNSDLFKITITFPPQKEDFDLQITLLPENQHNDYVIDWLSFKLH